MHWVQRTYINGQNLTKRYLSQFVFKLDSKANLWVGAWCAHIVEHSVGRMQDVEWCHNSGIYCPWLNTSLFRFYPHNAHEFVTCSQELLHVERPGLCSSNSLVIAPVPRGVLTIHFSTKEEVLKEYRNILNWFRFFVSFHHFSQCLQVNADANCALFRDGILCSTSTLIFRKLRCNSKER
jgi:hypothetical protein